jgi:hypothetical protein
VPPAIAQLTDVMPTVATTTLSTTMTLVRGARHFDAEDDCLMRPPFDD